MRVLLACDRSGGHIFPALSLGEGLRKEGKSPYFFTSSPYFHHYLRKRGYFSFGYPFPFRNLAGEGLYRFWEALFLLLRLRPKKIIGFGGRDSFFLLLWGRLLFMETSIYEPNFSLGRANKIISLFTKRVYGGFPETKASWCKTKYVGIPLRSRLKILEKNEARKFLGVPQEKPVILAVGGSQGSSFLNQIVIKFATSSLKEFSLIHLTGKKDYKEIFQIYSKIKRKILIKDFHEEMEILYSAADVLVSRAGALTLAEIVYFSIPAILFPYPYAHDHQGFNARYFQREGAAIVLSQKNFSFSKFKKILERLLEDFSWQEELRRNLKKLNLGVKGDEFYKRIFD